MQLDESQQFTLHCALGEREDQTWAAFEVADVEPRQNGKGDTIQAREATGLFLFGERLQIHTAHEFKTANEAFLRMVTLIESNPDLERQVQRIRFGNGEQGIELRGGARLKYAARTGGAGRGFAGADLVVFDESMFLLAEHVAAVLPTLSVNPNPQVWYGSSAGLSTSTQLWKLRKRALRGDAGRLAYVEHTAEDISLDEQGRIVSTPIDVYDRRLVAVANPAYGTRISHDFVEAEHDAMGDDKFARERLGVFDPLPEDEDLPDPKIPAEAWAETALPEGQIYPVYKGEVTFGVDVDTDSAGASIVVGAGTLAAPYVEEIEDGAGVLWLPRRLVELVNDWDPIAVGINPRGPAGAVIGEIIEAFREAGIPLERLHLVTAAEYPQMCMAAYTSVVENRLRRFPGQESMDDAVANAAERIVGEAFTWDRRKTATPIAPLVGMTIALGLLPEERQKEPTVWSTSSLDS